jgi:hypothetical protein
MATSKKSALRLVVVGRGETRGRRAHLIRIRESLLQELYTVADGQVYLLIEIALRRLIDELKARPAGIEAIQVQELLPSASDEYLLDQLAAKTARVSATLAKLSAKAKKKPPAKKKP